MATFGVVAHPILLGITWKKQLAVVEQVKVAKGGPAVMWACIAWMPIANLYIVGRYIVVKGITATSHCQMYYALI